MRLEKMRCDVLPGGVRVARARSLRQRLLGLMGMDELPDRWALRFDRCSSIHTLWMRFAIDLVWLDAAGAVLRVDRDVPPRRLRACRGARSVVETRAGEGADVARALAG